MELAFAAALIIFCIVGVVALIIGIPLVFGAMAYDLVKSRAKVPAPATAQDARMSIGMKRGIARAFVVLGSAFWSIATFAEVYSQGQANVGNATVWIIVTFMLIGPMLTASVLFWQARRDQDAYERATALRPQLAFVLAA